MSEDLEIIRELRRDEKQTKKTTCYYLHGG